MENPSKMELCAFHIKEIMMGKGHGDNGQILKLGDVHEGYEEPDTKRKKLKEAVYFGGLYIGKEEEESAHMASQVKLRY